MSSFWIFCVILFSLTGQAQSIDRIEGVWRYYKKVYQGQEIPEPPEASLRLFFQFYSDGTNRLFWYHEGQNDWCERLGLYAIKENFLLDEVTWVSPSNSRECGSDPDMQQGRKAITPISFWENGDLVVHLFLGDSPLEMVWRRMGK